MISKWLQKLPVRRSKLASQAVRAFFSPVRSFALKDLNFSINDFKWWVTSTNGAGKSTTIKILSGILYPDEGEVHQRPGSLEGRMQHVARIGVVFGQLPALVGPARGR